MDASLHRLAIAKVPLVFSLPGAELGFFNTLATQILDHRDHYEASNGIVPKEGIIPGKLARKHAVVNGANVERARFVIQVQNIGAQPSLVCEPMQSSTNLRRIGKSDAKPSLIRLFRNCLEMWNYAV
jgi:hypothetical protein